MRHPAVEHVLQFFVYAHLPPALQVVSKPFAELAETIADNAANSETTVALRKLLEAKDAAVRAVVAERNKERPGPAGAPIPKDEV